MIETIVRPIDGNGHVPENPLPAEPGTYEHLLGAPVSVPQPGRDAPETYDGFPVDPDFIAYRNMLAGFMKSLQTDVECVFTWLFEGVEVGGQLAFVSAMMAVGDYDRGVHPKDILHDLWQAYDRACEQTKGATTAAEMRALRAAAMAVRP